MGEFFKKNGSLVGIVAIVGSYVGVCAAAIARSIRGDKREKDYYKKQSEVQQSQIEYWRSVTTNKKES